jgi:pimeloyl-ACP methyl ester carboxylesterase
MGAETSPRELFLGASGERLHYLEWGTSENPPLILLHALGPLVTAWTWGHLGASLADRFRVLALEQRGFGESDRAPEYSLDQMVEDLDRFARALGLPHFSLLGHSMGGTVAYLFAERYPDRLVKIVIEDTAPPEKPPTPRPVPELTPEAFESFDQLIGRLKDQPGAPPEPELRELIRPAITQRADGRWIRRLDPALLPAIFAELNDPDPGWWEELHRITAPTLLVLGANSSYVSREAADRVLAAIPNCRVATVPEAGHGVHIDQPEGFLSTVRSFLL